MKAYWRWGFWAAAYWPPGFWLPEAPAGYRLYRGVGSPAAIDYDNPVAELPCGLDSAVLAGLGHQAGVEYWYGIRAVSSAGVEETDTSRVCRVVVAADGSISADRPNAIAWAKASAIAGGKLRVDFYYSSLSQVIPPASVELALASAGGFDWENPIATAAISGSIRGSLLPATVFEDGETVFLAIRAVGALGELGAALELAPVAADSSPPPAIDSLEAVQI